MSKHLPPLYQKTATGAIQVWKIVIAKGLDNEGVISTEYGQVGGKLQFTEESIRTGKNVGKKNETTPYEQAVKEGEARWTKKVKREGYVEDIEKAKAGTTDQEGGIPPMLAQVYEDIKDKHKQWPAWGQRKFNGNRLIVEVKDGVVSLWSRKQNRITSLPHIEAAYREIFKNRKGHFIFDGEGYRHGWSLQKISGFFKTKEPKEGYQELQHHVYDMPSSDKNTEGRQSDLTTALFEDDVNSTLLSPDSPIVTVQTIAVDNEKEMWKLHKEFVLEGYEGLILRQARGTYEAGKRSPCLAKVKEYRDAEFKVVGVGTGRGRYEGKAIFKLVTSGGIEFECNAPGTLEEKTKYLEEAQNYIGKALTVRYFELSEEGVPLQPTPLQFRDFE
jgi:DNA ligase-1